MKERDVEARGERELRELEAREASHPWRHPAPPHRFDLVGFPQVREWEEKYLPPEEMDKYAHSIGAYTPGEGQTHALK